MTSHRGTHPNSVVRCPRRNCDGEGTVEGTMKQDTWYVVRSRCCRKCGTTFSTAEVRLGDVRRLRRLDKIEALVRGETS